MKRAIITLISLSALVSCSKVKKMENLTEDMSNTTQKMSHTTNQMNATTNNMYPQIRTKESHDTRNKMMQIVLSDNQSLGDKIAAASAFYQSFEYQLWTNNGTYDTKEVREKLFYDAVNEYFMKLASIWDHIYGQSNLAILLNLDPNEMSPIETDAKEYNYEMAFYALSLVMHMNNHHQKHLVKTIGGFEEVSFYDLLKNALIKEHEGRELKDYEHIVNAGQNRDIAIGLLQARMNMMLALAVKNSTGELKELTLAQKLKAFSFKLSNGAFGTFQMKSTFNSGNESTKRDVLEKLDGFAKTKSLLESINEPLNLDPVLKNIIDNLSIEDDLSNKANQEFISYIEMIRSL